MSSANTLVKSACFCTYQEVAIKLNADSLAFGKNHWSIKCTTLICKVSQLLHAAALFPSWVCLRVDFGYWWISSSWYFRKESDNCM